MNKKLFPYIAIAYVLVFLFIQVIAELGTLTVESLIQHETLGKIDPIGTIIAAVIFSLVTIALFVWMKWATISKDFVMTRPWDLLFCETAQQMVGIMNTPGGYAVICLLAPIAEELVFRGAVLRKLLEWKPERRWLMITLSALLFALAHMNPAQLLHPFLIGLLLGWLYERTGSIVPGIIFHWANNTVAYLLIRIYQDPDITITQIFGSQSRVMMAVGFSLLIFLPALYQLNQRMKK